MRRSCKLIFKALRDADNATIIEFNITHSIKDKNIAYLKSLIKEELASTMENNGHDIDKLYNFFFFS